jgi:RNA polymerase sigma-70 factor (ECF subfamily)
MPGAGAAPSSLEQHRGYLLRYARLHLRDQTAAEDVVQETLLAALEGGARFLGKSALRTWLTGILKHKVVDHMRRTAREEPYIRDGGDDAQSEAEAIEALFRVDGHWQRFPRDWGSPERAFENKAFWAVFEKCAQNLPRRTARVFMLREVMDLSTEEICKELGITATNCWVMLHRARLALRECLETNWFGKT